MIAKSVKLNPFETIWSHRKFDVLGKKRKGEEKRIGLARSRGIEKVTKQSCKFCPETIIFLQTLLVSASDTELSSYQHSQFYHLAEPKTLKPWLLLQNRVSDIESLDFLSVMDLPEDSPVFCSDNFRASILFSVIEMLRGFATVYEGFNSFPEIFFPMSTLLHKLAKQENIPDRLQCNIRDAAWLLEDKAYKHHMLRQPLQMQKQKPVPMKQLVPKFEEKDYDPDCERAEKKKLKKLLKREAKGAARELRKDNYFIYEVKQKDTALLEEEKAEKYKKAKIFLEEQEHAFKSGQLGRGTKRK